MLSLPASQCWKIAFTIQSKLRRENANKCLKGDKYELLVSNALIFLMTEDDLKFGIIYRQWLLYRARSFVSRVKRSYKASEEARPLRKQHVLKSTLQNSSMITDPEENQEERNEGDAEGGYANKEHLTMVLPLKALEETRYNGFHLCTCTNEPTGEDLCAR